MGKHEKEKKQQKVESNEKYNSIRRMRYSKKKTLERKSKNVTNKKARWRKIYKKREWQRM